MTAAATPLTSIANAFSITDEQFRAIVEGFKAECDLGLARPLAASDPPTMIPSFVTRMPTGDETGTFLSLDLGGSNLRVSAVELLGQGQVQVAEVKRTVTDDLRTGAVDAFFDWIADAVQELLLQQGMEQRSPEHPLAMGVCWSFPVDQTSILHGRILRMGKGFTLDGIEGQDLAGLFHQAFERKGLGIVVTALLNDTVGTLVAHAYSHPGACIGFIYGTGVNAAYPEKTARIGKLHAVSGSSSSSSSNNNSNNNSQDNDGVMLVNTEIDLFGNESYLPRTSFDRALDQQHSQPGFQVYEKMMSGAYLGELVRLVIVALTVEHKVMFDGHLPDAWKEPWSLSTTWMGEMESMQGAEQRLEAFHEWISGAENTSTLNDVELLMQVCTLVSDRAATLAAAAMAAIIEQQGVLEEPADIIIGVNGSTFEKYPRMGERIHAQLRSWFGDDVAARIRLDVAKDGSSIGGALIAMLYHQSITHDPKIDQDACVSCFPPWITRRLNRLTCLQRPFFQRLLPRRCRSKRNTTPNKEKLA